jgi:hypothetical protein
VARRPRILHPVLFALYPGLALLAHNRTQIEPSEALRALALTVAAVAVLWWALTRVLRSAPQAALITSVAVLLFFSYGHVYYLARGVPALASTLGRHRYLILIWAAVFGFGTWALLRWRRGNALQGAMNWVAAGAVLIPLAQIALLLLAPEPAAEADATPAVSAASADPLPDIYYIVLDAYAREDVLAELFDYDNTGFLDFLRGAGFFVADQSHSNYAQTSLSLSSSLNFDYVDQFVPAQRPSADPLGPLFEAIRDSRLRRTLEALGYTTVAFATGFRGTELRDFDRYLSPGDQALQAMHAVGGINAFEGMLIQTSAGVLVTTALGQLPEQLRPDLQVPYRAHRARIEFALEGLGSLEGVPSPRFVFVHLVSPHPPFVFGPNGEEIENTDAYTLKNGVFLGNRSTYIQRYRDQVTYLNGRLEALLPDLIAGRAPSPVIVIQSDHGPDASSVGDEPSQVRYVDERLTNLIAVRLGDCGSDQL